MSSRILSKTVAVILPILGPLACTPSSQDGDRPGGTPTEPSGGTEKAVIRITGSDTMVNLAQAWAEIYGKKYPQVSIQVSGGGSSVGITGLINGTVDLANASRKMKPTEVARAKKKNGVPPKEYTVGLDALAVYVHKHNPANSISLESLAGIYGEKGEITKWSQLGVQNKPCSNDTIVRVSRQNNSGTYHYFREAVLGKGNRYKLGSIDQSGSKDVVSLVANTPCSIGYSGMGYATPEVKMLKVSKTPGGEAVPPTAENAANGHYPISRPLFIYAREEPKGAIKDYMDWILSQEGQSIVAKVGYVPVKAQVQ